MVKFDIKETGKSLRAAFSHWQLWHNLAVNDIRTRYQRTLLGPLWFPLSLAVFATGLTLVFSSFFRADGIAFLAYVAFGLAIWGLISRVIVESANVYNASAPIIHQLPVPLVVHNIRLVYRNILIFLHEFTFVLLVIAFYGQISLMKMVYLIPALSITIIALFFTSLIVAIICTRFRDIPHLIELVMRFLFFLSPVFWISKQGKVHEFLAFVNPINHVLNITRGPFTGPQTDFMFSSQIVLSITVVLAFVFFALFARYRHIVPYWI